MAPRMYTPKPLLLSTAVLALFATPALAAPKVVASIPPIHSVVAGVMEGVGEPELLVPGGASPHSYAMRPSEARALSEADVVFWVGEPVETFLEEPLHADFAFVSERFFVVLLREGVMDSSSGGELAGV